MPDKLVILVIVLGIVNVFLGILPFYIMSIRYNTEVDSSIRRHQGIKLQSEIQMDVIVQNSNLSALWNQTQNRLIITSNQKEIFSTPAKGGFMSCGIGDLQSTDYDSFWLFKEYTYQVCRNQVIQRVVKKGQTLIISGSFKDCINAFFKVNITLIPDQHQGFDFKFECIGRNRTYVRYKSEKNESFLGFGEQFSIIDMKGKNIPLFVREHGFGRGKQPLTFLLNNFLKGSGGSWFYSYIPSPVYITNYNKTLILMNNDYSAFSFKKKTEAGIYMHSSVVVGRLYDTSSPLESIEKLTLHTGRMKPLPKWITSGAILGLQGGSLRVLELYNLIKSYNASISGIWLQDWVGKRQLKEYSRLWWNWELDEQHYPQWNEMKNLLQRDNVKLLTYINPFLIDASEKPGFKRNLYQEAKDNNYLIRDSITGDIIQGNNLAFGAALLDFSQPKTREWYKSIIKDNMLNNSGISGFMADFGEAFQLENVLLENGYSGYQYHNQYPIQWSKLCKEAIEEYYGEDNEIVFFTRSGYLNTPNYSRLIWAGDQVQVFDRDIGLGSAVKALISSGISGYQLSHSEIGGYHAITKFGFNYIRTEELLLRWMELSAFNAVYRSHEGDQPDKTLQIYSNEKLLRAFAKFSHVYAAWGEYREFLMKEAQEKGYPLIRHLFLHYPNDPETIKQQYQFLVGSDILVSPVISSSAYVIDVYFPQNLEETWINIWDGKEYQGCGCHKTIRSKLGTPPVYYKKGSIWGEKFIQELKARNII